MKQTIFSLAVFLYLSADAQQTVNTVTNKLRAYRPVKFETLKQFKSPAQTNNAGRIIQPIIYTPVKNNMPAVSFKPLQGYLSQDIRYSRLQQKTNEWTQFDNGSINSLYKKQWLENKNNVQQRWMMQKVKGK